MRILPNGGLATPAQRAMAASMHGPSTGAVGRTSTYALCNVTLPWALEIARRGIERAAKELRPIAKAINLMGHEVTNRAVAETFGMKYSGRWEK